MRGKQEEISNALYHSRKRRFIKYSKRRTDKTSQNPFQVKHGQRYLQGANRISFTFVKFSVAITTAGDSHIVFLTKLNTDIRGIFCV